MPFFCRNHEGSNHQPSEMNQRWKSNFFYDSFFTSISKRTAKGKSKSLKQSEEENAPDDKTAPAAVVALQLPSLTRHQSNRHLLLPFALPASFGLAETSTGISTSMQLEGSPERKDGREKYAAFLLCLSSRNTKERGRESERKGRNRRQQLLLLYRRRKDETNASNWGRMEEFIRRHRGCNPHG